MNSLDAFEMLVILSLGNVVAEAVKVVVHIGFCVRNSENSRVMRIHRAFLSGSEIVEHQFYPIGMLDQTQTGGRLT